MQKGRIRASAQGTSDSLGLRGIVAKAKDALASGFRTKGSFREVLPASSKPGEPYIEETLFGTTYLVGGNQAATGEA
ncbi:hypothetical protein RSO01_61660 [Reyranella soli]|uniref:Uncharacterized protein n=1 Tax=Reyranella soli TaxID=1230389 RepID=A0A512NJ72_9HYPH|nr:hypothetical protein RSO01_61660 [Reyranella soli]